ncbi:hypothetical protein [Kitasatospora sp. NBC_01300]|uniref:hypothetical protein n=1 Tax=Kitasatospora sp. NBC_01300 TaxID=2903574 RepID=UPI00352D5127|nr:hypothetical protein OG556_18560 [Kitasatospora sp. NBC_01300]
MSLPTSSARCAHTVGADRGTVLADFLRTDERTDERAVERTDERATAVAGRAMDDAVPAG